MGHVAHFCPKCKLMHDTSGRPMIMSTDLRSEFNPLKMARDTISGAHPQAAPVVRTALEVALIQGFQECYFAGLKDGAMLAYSQENPPHGQLSEPLQDTANDTREGERAL